MLPEARRICSVWCVCLFEAPKLLATQLHGTDAGIDSPLFFVFVFMFVFIFGFLLLVLTLFLADEFSCLPLRHQSRVYEIHLLEREWSSVYSMKRDEMSAELD